MGNEMTCMPRKEGKEIARSRSTTVVRSHRKMGTEEEALHMQALAIAMQHHSQRFDGSLSRRISGANGKQNLPGVTSSRRRNLPESLSHEKLTPDIIENMETKKFVLIHGEGFGAWCWYKSIAFLEEAGFLPIALDLTGSGTDNTDTSSVTSLTEYAKPLIDYLSNLTESEKVILVGHSCAGACVSYALELFPKKVSKAVFLSAAMVSNGQRPFDVFAEESQPDKSKSLQFLQISVTCYVVFHNDIPFIFKLAFADIFSQESQVLIHGNGKGMPPTGLKLKKHQIKDLYFNQSPAKDIALAAVSMRPIPLGPIMERLTLSKENHGSVRQFFIQALEDRLLPPIRQENMVKQNVPERVYKIRGSDHCPFFSKPLSLHKILLEIAKLP
ncbi:putative methylesterase 12 [Nymphaea thermarum]|nr:putative methylesterase 12 [Nymphaea thermarum]